MRNKKTLYIVVQIAIFIILLVTSQMMFYTYRVTRHNEELLDIAEDWIQEFKDNAYESYSIIRAFSRDLDLNANDEGYFKELCNEYVNRYPFIEYVIHTNVDGVNDKVYSIDSSEEKFNYLLNKSINIKEISDSHFQDIKISGYDLDTIKVVYTEREGDKFNGVITIGINIAQLAQQSINTSILEKYYIKIYDTKGNEIFDNSSKQNINGRIESIRVEEIIWKTEIGDKINFKKEVYLDICISSVIVIILVGIFMTLEMKLLGKNKYIDELESLKKEIENMAYTDGLTNLPNRLKIVSLLEKYIEDNRGKSKKCAVIFIDLDKFKDINDTLGHDYGDELLKRTAKKISEFCDDKLIASRIGGDEFVLILLDVENKEYVNDTCKKILADINTKFNINNKEVTTTASIGVSMYPEHGEDVFELFRNADIAMYKSKTEGKNRFKLFNNNMRESMERRLQIEELLDNAIENNELEIHYQPQVNLIDRKFYDMEALIRWNSSVLGNVPPDEFIQIAEETGRIRKIGEWVISNSCRQLKKWEKEGYSFRSISINISPVQLKDRNFVNKIKSIVEKEDVDISKITLEITERLLIKNMAYCNKVIRELKEIGFKISLDDFGTGYSSLNYLSKLPIDTLKIDKSFIDNITTSSKDFSLLKGVIDLAHLIELEIVAEGVETKDQCELLNGLGSDLIQGYYFSKPISSDEISLLYNKLNKE